MNTPVLARCRLLRDYDICVALSVICRLFFLGMPFFVTTKLKPGETIGVAFMTVLSALAPIYWVLARRRGVLLADGSGVRWRTALGGWRRANYAEIESANAYVTSSPGIYRFVVTTKNGAFSFTRAFSDIECFVDALGQNSEAVPRHLSHFPRTFSYSLGPARCYAILGMLASLAYLPMTVGRINWHAASEQLPIYLELYGPVLAYSGATFLFLLMISFPVGAFAISWSILKGTKVGANESFVVSPRGLAWKKEGNEEEKAAIFAAWDELMTLHIEARGRFVAVPFYRLETTQGDISWSIHFQGNQELQAALNEFAPNLKEHRDENIRENLLPETEVVGGTRVFHYRTRSLRSLIWFAALMCIPWPLQIFMRIREGIAFSVGELIYFVALFLLFAGITSGLSLLFWRTRLQTDESGLHRAGAFGARFIAWSEIRELFVNEFIFIVRGEHGTIRFSGVVNQRELVQEIERRSGKKFEKNSRAF